MKSIKKTSIAMVLAIATLSLSGINFMPAATAAPATFTVDSTSDAHDADFGGTFDGICDDGSGNCTLRAAMEEANATADADTIEFTISGGGVQTITPGSDLPEIIQPLTVDGYTNNPGATANTAAAPNPMDGTILVHIVASETSGTLFNIASDDVTLKGLSLTECAVACIYTGSDNGIFQGNYIGVDPTGLATGASLSDIGISIYTDADNTLIGGTDPEDRNVINAEGPDNTTTGSINIAGTNVTVYGNIVGLGKDGMTDLSPEAADVNGLSGNWVKGIQTLGVGPATVGGTSAGMTNIFSGAGNNVSIGGQDATFQGNIIGPDYTGEVNPDITNGLGVVASAQANGNLLGGTNPGEGNIIAGIGATGVSTLSITIEAWAITLDPTRLAILGNSIYDVNVLDFEGIGDSNLGIDHAGYTDTTSPTPDFLPESFQNRGPTLNDVDGNGDPAPGDLDTGPNNLMNFPVLNTAVQTGSDLAITYDLDVTGSDSDQYRVEFFANERSTIFGYGPGQTYLGSQTTSNGSGKSVTLDVGAEDYSNMSLSATVTSLDSTSPTTFGDTSEFALNILIGSDTDFDADTIPDAIENAAPNSGDANADGTLDSLQPTVSSFVSATSGDYTTFETDICYSNGYIDSLSINDIGETDTGFSYPYGLTDFELNCPLAEAVTIDKFIFTPDTDTTNMSIRKYSPETDSFISAQSVVEELNTLFEDLNAPDVVVESTTIGGEHAIHLTYTLKDGEVGDDDGLVNGIIADPVGLAQVFVSSTPGVSNPSSDKTTASGTLANTGAKNITVQAIIAFSVLLLGLGMVVATRNKKPVK